MMDSIFGHRRNGRRTLVSVLVVLLFMLTSGMRYALPAEQRLARDVKAAFLLNFTKFVKWPENSFDGEDSPMVIGVLGVDPFEHALDKVVSGHKAHGRKLQVRRLAVVDGEFPPTEQLAGCHLLFVSKSERDLLPLIFERLRGMNVMTVSDLEDFAASGGVAEFVPVGPNIKFKINRQAARRAGLRPSAKLLKLAIP
jgi:hypothetical protein